MILTSSAALSLAGGLGCKVQFYCGVVYAGFFFLWAEQLSDPRNVSDHEWAAHRNLVWRHTTNTELRRVDKGVFCRQVSPWQMGVLKVIGCIRLC